MTEPTLPLCRMVADLIASGELVEQWREVFASVPRHVFIPEVVWWENEDIDGPADLVPLRRADDPDAWLELAYGPDFVITQVDDGDPVGPAGRGHYATSSASMPAVVADMLAKLNAHPGMRVLEIGTGTGYNAALTGASAWRRERHHDRDRPGTGHPRAPGSSHGRLRRSHRHHR